MQAGEDLTLTASDVRAGKDASLAAGNDLNLNAQQTSQSSRNGNSENHSTGLDRTTVSAGGNLILTAGQDIHSQAAGLAAEQQVGMQAGRDVDLQAAEMTQGDSYKARKKNRYQRAGTPAGYGDCQRRWHHDYRRARYECRSGTGDSAGRYRRAGWA